eukprot:TRINITY_DN17231_c0_g2_i1.p1 TRINITY_DN17231_c0_g2~~TRINITY_DN17231_c0_g2_i1.p1  ORF type:complete len:140 (+),score=35.13 TRINITY_DN17231_c0_g2_i1:66-485(+)
MCIRDSITTSNEEKEGELQLAKEGRGTVLFEANNLAQRNSELENEIRDLEHQKAEAEREMLKLKETYHSAITIASETGSKFSKARERIITNRLHHNGGKYREDMKENKEESELDAARSQIRQLEEENICVNLRMSVVEV